MTSINTQSNVIANSLNTALPLKPSNDPTVIEAANTSQLLKTTLTLSDDFKSEDSVAYDPEKGGYNPNMPALVLLKSKSIEERDAIELKEAIEYDQEPKLSADAALTRLNREMVALQHKIEAVKPDLLGKKWDLVLKNDKIEVVGSGLATDDKQWLENTLNRNKTVVGAVKDFYAAVVKHYEHTEDHPSAAEYRNDEATFAYGVAEQIDGKLQLRSIMDKLITKQGKAFSISPNPFIDGMEVAGSYLKTSNEATYFRNNADMTDPETAAYVISSQRAGLAGHPAYPPATWH